MNCEKETLVNFLKKNKAAVDSEIKANPKPISKSSEESEKARKEGNALFMQNNHTAQQHQEIFRLYSKSVALAHPLSEELATAYYNRSSFLMHVGKFKEGIEDIDKALNITNSKAMRIKLLCRKTRCFYRWNGTKKHGIIDEIKHLLGEMIGNSEEKAALKKLLNDTTSYLHPSNISKIKEDPFLDRFSKDFQGKDEENMYESITVNYSKKNGRYLTANRDFSPGDIIYVEPFYAAVLNIFKSYTHCQNCLVVCWSGIPCNQCNWAMFCSERCKSESMEKFHDVECQLIPQILNFGEVTLMSFRLSVRILIMAIKEAGSVKKLRHQLKVVDRTMDSNPQNIYMAEQLEHNFASFYSLKPNARATIPDFIMFLLPKIVVTFIKYSHFFDKLESVDDILKNGDMMFVGTLLTRIQKLQEMNNYILDTVAKNCKHEDDPQGEQQSDHKLQCSRGSGFALVDSFLPHSCTPNIRRSITEGKKIIIYALQPIKKNSQLFECYFQPFYLANKQDRRKHHQSFHQLKCKCEACVHDWTSPMTDPFKFPRMSEKEHEFSSYLTELQTFMMMSAINDKPNFKEFIQVLSKYLKKAFKELDPSCFTICTMITILKQVFNDCYMV